ncbi:MAG: tRNA (guanine(46)-N(7))-methyltransferase TrmB [Acetobacteraceae bacterium]
MSRRTLTPLAPRLKPPPERLYGRARGHKLRPRQELLLARALERFSFPAAAAGAPAAAFGAPPAELWLEIGAGSFEHAEGFLAARPQAALIAAEVFENGLASVLSRLVPEGAEETAAPPARLRLWPGDGRKLLAILPDSALAGLILMFPDPWPKARHARRRFVHPAALPEIARVMRAGAEWRIASDDPTYHAWVAMVMGEQAYFAPAAPAPARPDGWPGTRYEAKALAAGRAPLYWSFRRRG